MTSFVHLHLHSEYSLLDGGNRIDRLVARVKELGMDAVALTDHGNLHGAVEFYSAAKAAGIKPILGIEAYVAPDLNGQPSDRTQRQFTGVADGGFHLVLLAENQTGWQNLIKLSSDAYIRGFYYRPRMDKTTLAQWSDGLIAINGHLGSSVAYHLERFLQSQDPRHWEAAAAEARWHARTFKPDPQGRPRFYLEIQRHGQPEQDAINPLILKLAKELDIPVVADNDAHFLLADDHDAHDTLICVSTGKLKTEENRLRYSPELYVKSPRQMAELFADVPQAIANTRAIADRCNVKLDFSANHAPAVKIAYRADAQALARHPRGSSDWFAAFCAQYALEPFDALRDQASAAQIKADCDAALRALTEAGAVWRYGDAGLTEPIRQRMQRELAVLADKNIAAYFLIVWDFVREARKRGIPVNARGSGVGTMVGYCLGLSNACPVKYGLLFERFTDPDRSEYPDIDIDLCQDGRPAIIDYVRQKYGHVAQIITFGTLKARAAVRDVGRVLNIPLPTVDKVCKLIGGALNMTLEKALDQEPQLRELYDSDRDIRQMLDTARRLEGHARHAGVHAAGVVIATQPLDNIVPLYQPPGTDQLVTQWDGPTVGKVGLLKMDFLGLRTLSIIERARQLIRQTLSPQVIRQTVGAQDANADPLDLERLSYDDPAVLALFSRGETAGVFQFESGGMRNLLMAMKPDRLEDLIAANALYRPGPMALIDDYNARKHGRQPVPAIHPIVDKFTAETYGIMVYQEQVMQIVHELGGIPLRAAYTLIRAIGKKNRQIIEANRTTFLEGAAARGLPATEAQRLWDMILQFAGYGFNKSHSTGYAILAYQTAYLKTYFPVHYMAAVLTYESVSTDKVVEYIDACRHVLWPGQDPVRGRRGIDVRPPDINLSEAGFTVVYDQGEPRDATHGHIRFGLSAVKGVGEKAVAAIVAARQPDRGGPFKNLYDFCERVPTAIVNRATIEPLIKCGAFDCLHGSPSRAALLEALDSAMQAGQRAAADRAAGQMSFFDSLLAPSPLIDSQQRPASQPAASVSERSSDSGGTDVPPVVLPEIKLPNVPPFSRLDQGKYEKEVLGFYWTDPLQEHRPALDRFSNVSLAGIRALPADTAVFVGGMLTRLRTTLTKQGRSAGQKMAMLTLSDGNDSVEAVAFAETYAQYAPLLQPDAVLFFRGRVDRRRQVPAVIVEAVIPAADAPRQLTRTVLISLRAPADHGHANGNGQKPFSGELAKLKTLLMQSRQPTVRSAGDELATSAGAQVLLEVHQSGHVAQLRVNHLRIAVDPDLPARVHTVLGHAGACELLGPQKLHVDLAAAAETSQPDLPMFSDSGELCASLDRY